MPSTYYTALVHGEPRKFVESLEKILYGKGKTEFIYFIQKQLSNIFDVLKKKKPNNEEQSEPFGKPGEKEGVLFQACVDNNAELVKNILKESKELVNFGIEWSTNDIRYPISFPVEKGNLTILKMLLKEKVDINKGEVLKLAILNCVRFGRKEGSVGLEIVKELVKKIDDNFDFKSMNYLYFAAFLGLSGVVDDLLEKGEGKISLKFKKEALERVKKGCVLGVTKTEEKEIREKIQSKINPEEKDDDEEEEKIICVYDFPFEKIEKRLECIVQKHQNKNKSITFLCFEIAKEEVEKLLKKVEGRDTLSFVVIPGDIEDYIEYKENNKFKEMKIEDEDIRSYTARQFKTEMKFRENQVKKNEKEEKLKRILDFIEKENLTIEEKMKLVHELSNPLDDFVE